MIRGDWHDLRIKVVQCVFQGQSHFRAPSLCLFICILHVYCQQSPCHHIIVATDISTSQQYPVTRRHLPATGAPPGDIYRHSTCSTVLPSIDIIY